MITKPHTIQIYHFCFVRLIIYNLILSITILFGGVFFRQQNQLLVLIIFIIIVDILCTLTFKVIKCFKKQVFFEDFIDLILSIASIVLSKKILIGVAWLYAAAYYFILSKEQIKEPLIAMSANTIIGYVYILKYNPGDSALSDNGNSSELGDNVRTRSYGELVTCPNRSRFPLIGPFYMVVVNCDY